LSSYDGVQVVCHAEGIMLTAYRNRNFKGLRRRLGRKRSTRPFVSYSH
jgi:hypothetical protein